MPTGRRPRASLRDYRIRAQGPIAAARRNRRERPGRVQPRRQRAGNGEDRRTLRAFEVTPRPWPPPALSVWDYQRSGVRNFLHLQWYHPHPEHGFVADVDIVFAHEGQLAVIANAEHRQSQPALSSPY